jgi:gluconate 2-dehydrogenase alpha chain
MSTAKPAVDAVIVGGGWTGSIIGKELAAAGLKVVMLERGENRWTSPDYQSPQVHDELKYQRRNHTHQDASKETYTFRNSVDQTALPMRRFQFAFPGSHLGGSGMHWSGAFYRYDENEFRFRSHYTQRYGAGIFGEDITPQDWPLSYAELEPYYERFEKLTGASGQAGNLRGKLQPGGNPFEAPRNSPYPNPPMRVPYASALFGEAAAGMGYHPFIQPTALATRPYVNSEGLHMGACMYCGFCSNHGCEHYAKASPQVCILPNAMKLSNFELRTRAQVLRAELTPDRKRATGVTYVDAAGQEIFQPAEMVFFCGFAINNVRLLLLSRIGTPYDPTNGRGTVGRNYTHQTTASVNMFFDANTTLNPFMGAGAAAVTMDDFNADNFDHGPLGFVGGGYIQIQVVGGAPIGFRPTPKSVPPWGSEFKKAMARYWNHAMPIQITGASMPVRGGGLDLDPTYKDAWGQPLLRITYDFSDNDIKQSAFLTAKALEIAKRIRGVQITEPNPRTKPYSSIGYQTTHLTGGATISATPKDGVVNRYGQCWDVPNVFVAGSAVFPQNSGYNPTATVGAMSYWMVDALKRDYLRNPGPLVRL